MTPITPLSESAQVIIPNAPSNSGRALHLLAQAELIELADGAGVSATQQDIADAEGLITEELDAASLPRSLPDADIAVINTNVALEAGPAPGADALALEDAADNPYANVLVVRSGDQTSDDVATLADLLTSDEVAAFIQDTSDGAVVPAT